MSKKPFTQDVFLRVFNSQYAFLAILGFGIYAISHIGPEQQENIRAFLLLLDTPPGYGILIFLGVFMLYALFFYPLGKFFSHHLAVIYTQAQMHFLATTEHHKDTKFLVENVNALVISITQLTDKCNIIVKKFEP